MNLQPSTDQITVQQTFLHSTTGLVFKVGNVTLDGTKWTAGSVVKAGTAIMMNATGDLAIPYNATTTGRVYVTTTDVIIPADGGNAQIGALEEGYLKSSRVTGVADATVFEQKSNYRFRMR